MTARCADEPARWIGLQPPLAFAPVPDTVLGTEHPPTPFAIENREVTHRHPVCARLQRAGATLFDERAVTDLGLGERIDCHLESIARSGS